MGQESYVDQLYALPAWRDLSCEDQRTLYDKLGRPRKVKALFKSGPVALIYQQTELDRKVEDIVMLWEELTPLEQLCTSDLFDYAYQRLARAITQTQPFTGTSTLYPAQNLAEFVEQVKRAEQRPTGDVSSLARISATATIYDGILSPSPQEYITSQRRRISKLLLPLEEAQDQVPTVINPQVTFYTLAQLLKTHRLPPARAQAALRYVVDHQTELVELKHFSAITRNLRKQSRKS